MSIGQVRLIAPLSVHTGYAKFGRSVLHALLHAGYEVEAVESDALESVTQFQDGRRTRERVMPESKIPIPAQQAAELDRALAVRVAPDAPTFLLQLPHNLSCWSQYAAAPLLGWTMTESDNLCDGWKHGARNVDMMVAPSRFCLDTFRRVVPEVPSELLHIPTDERLWEPAGFRGEVANNPPSFLFFSAFTTSERKNWRMLCQAFAEEFAREQKEVGLLLKPTRWPEVEQLADCCRCMGAWVYVDCEPCTDYVMAAKYRACSVYVQPSSEGFGLGPVEAGMCGKPSVVLGLGGAADVVDENIGYVVPSVMAPIMGHAPHWYPRTHNFATCDIDDLRKTLRRAYEEERVKSKGEAARASMMARFSADAMKEKFAERIADGIAVKESVKKRIANPAKPRWATAAGAWGDVFCCVGNIQEELRKNGLDEIGVIFIGRDQRIADWLSEQPWCREVVSITVESKGALDKVFAKLSQCKAVHGQAEVKRLVSEYLTIDPDTIAFTHLTMQDVQEPKYWSDPVLDADAHRWAREQSSAIGRPFYILNPLSVASNDMKDHWRYWSEGIEWLIRIAEAHDVVYALVSEKVIEWPAHPRLINLSGKSRTMQDVLALAERSHGIISTSNNLGIYAPLVKLKSVIVNARTLTPTCFYHQWMEHPCIRMVEYDDAMPQFKEAVYELFAETTDKAKVTRKTVEAVREAVCA
jgi:glycosyltransferase involved in cell wall biosynthesis